MAGCLGSMSGWQVLKQGVCQRCAQRCALRARFVRASRLRNEAPSRLLLAERYIIIIIVIIIIVIIIITNHYQCYYHYYRYYCLLWWLLLLLLLLLSVDARRRARASCAVLRDRAVSQLPEISKKQVSVVNKITNQTNNTKKHTETKQQAPVLNRMQTRLFVSFSFVSCSASYRLRARSLRLALLSRLSARLPAPSRRKTSPANINERQENKKPRNIQLMDINNEMNNEKKEDESCSSPGAARPTDRLFPCVSQT